MRRILLGCMVLVCLTAPVWAAVTPLQYTQSTLEQACAIVDSDQTHNEKLAALSALTGGFRAVRLDRDGPSGIRLAGLFAAWGMILGRAVAGDWESTRRTWTDFAAHAWPVLAFLIVAASVERMLRPTLERPRVPWPAGVGPAVGYLAAAVEVAAKG